MQGSLPLYSSDGKHDRIFRSSIEFLARTRAECALIAGCFAYDAGKRANVVALISFACLAYVGRCLLANRIPEKREMTGVNHDVSSTVGRYFLLCGGAITVSGIGLRSTGMTVFGTFVLILRFITVRRPDYIPDSIARFTAGSATLLLGIFVAEYLPLVPFDTYIASVLRVFGTLGGAFPSLRIGFLSSCVVIDGIPIHVGHFVPSWGLIPIGYDALLHIRCSMSRLVRLLTIVTVLVCLRGAVVYECVLFESFNLLVSPISRFGELTAAYLITFFVWYPVVAIKAPSVFPPYCCVPVGVGLLLSIMPFVKDCRPSTIAIDQMHGQWETVDATFSMNDFGRDTVYNYALLREWLEDKYEVILVKDGFHKVTADVIIVKMPTTFFTEFETSYLREFVNKGGRLLVIGDHTNLFGTSAIINDLLNWSGLQINFDAVIPTNAKYHDYVRKWWNPIWLQPGIDRLEFQTGATLSSRSLRAGSVILADDVVAEDAEYTNERFFGDLTASCDDRPGPISLCAVRQYGRGEVILFTDSTIWSNFSFYAGSNERLFDALVNPRKRLITPKLTLLSCFGAWSLCVASALHRRTTLVWPSLRECFAWSLCVSSVVVVMQRASDMSYLSWGGSAVVGHPERVAFDAENSNVELRADSRRGSVDDIYDYSTFYAWLSRFGMHPHFTHEAYEDSSVPAILVNPKATLGKRAKERIVTYLRDGGRLLLLFDSGVTAPHELNSFLNEFDIVLVPVQKGFGVFDANGPDFQNSPLSLAFDVLTTTHAARGAKRLDTQTVSFGLSGVTPLVVDDNGVIIAGERRVGKGRITVFSRSMIFSEFVFGDVWGGKELEDDKRRLYNFGRELAEHACKFEE